MRLPPLLLGSAMLFWGWQTGLLWLGLIAAVMLESSTLVKTHWEFAQADLDRLWNLCITLFLGATIYAFVSNDNLGAVNDLIRDYSASNRLATLNQTKRSLFQLLQWLPLIFLPMALTQTYSGQKPMDLSTFSWWLRRRRTDPAVRARYLADGVHIGYPYLACCLFSASAGNQRSFWFLVGLSGLAGWGLWRNRSGSFSAAKWFACLGVAFGLGIAAQSGILELQKLMQRLDEMLLARWSGNREFDSKETQTRIGAIGKLKLSGRIVLRLQARQPPALLREATYSSFRAPVWSAPKGRFEHVIPDPDQSSWNLRRVPKQVNEVLIAGLLRGGNGLLALPAGVARLDHLPAAGISTNGFGSVRVDDGPGFVQFEAAYGAGPSIDSRPGSEDVEVPLQERPAITAVAAQLRLSEQTHAQALRTVEQFFVHGFTYSTWQGAAHRADPSQTALARFLLENRSGHCEYFATATVLLLRAAGIPARYAVGYAVREKQGRYYVVRERHAHAWCSAWVDGAWREVDTTPANWLSAESSRRSAWEAVGDVLSQIWFEFSRWRWGHADWKRYLLWLMVPGLGLVLARLLAERQWRRARQTAQSGRTESRWPGLDSEFYMIEEKLAAAGFPREPGETSSAWLQRIGRSQKIPVEGLEALLAVHYRLRFDPFGLSPDERRQFRAAVDTWLPRVHNFSIHAQSDLLNFDHGTGRHSARS